MFSTHCAVPGCNNTVCVHILEASGHVCTRVVGYCLQDADKHLPKTFYSSSWTQGLSPGAKGDVRFEIEYVVVFANKEVHNICLREFRGSRILVFDEGTFEAMSIWTVLKGTKFSRPLTHAAMASLVIALGGELRDVIIDQIDDSTGCYCAKLRIDQRGQIILVDVRPSDAFALALEFKVPILVAEHVANTSVHVVTTVNTEEVSRPSWTFRIGQRLTSFLKHVT